MLARSLTFATFIVAAWSSVQFLGYPNNGNISITCGTTATFNVGNYFSQSCIANNCPAPVTFTWSPDLTEYGFSLSTINPAKIEINPRPAAIAMGSLSTTITASDTDGTPAQGAVRFNLNCPLTLTAPIPDQDLTEGNFWSLNASNYFSNPAGHTLTWRLVGFANSSAIKISSTGLISGIPAVMDATAPQPIMTTVVVTDTNTGDVVSSNVFRVRVSPLPGITFQGPIPNQNGTEGILFSLNAARYFLNPSNFRVSWSVSTVLSAFVIDNSTGAISFTPGVAELLMTRVQPVSVIVSGVDERGNLATSNTFTFQVTPAKLLVLPVPAPLPSLNCGSFCCGWNVADYVSNPSSNPATYTLVSGIPSGSLIQLSRNGTFSGLASIVDVRASPLTLQVQVTNGDTPVTLPPFIFSVVGLAAPTISGVPLPVRTVQVGTFFSLDTKSYFTVPAGSVANWTLTGSPSLSIDFSGKVTGTLQDSDYTNSPTLSFTVSVSNRGTCGGGIASQTFQFTIDPNWQGPSCSVGTQADINVCEKSTFPYRNFSALCRDPKGSPLTYSIIGLPNNTGLTFDTTTGTLRGVVSTTAADSPATSVQICAMNAHALQACSTPFQINFQRAKRPPIADPPIPSPVTAILGQRFVGYFNFHFYEPDWQPLIYSVAGLPVGSGLGIGPITGIFSGTPNMADFRASPLVLSVFASNEQNVNRNSACASQGQGGRARADMIIIIEKPPALPICMPIPADNSVAQIGMFWARDVSTSFQPGEGATKLEFALRSLPRGSGLSIDPRSGVVSGVLSQQDLTSSPLTIVVAATNGYGSCQSNFQLNVVPRIRPVAVQPSPVARPTTGGRPGVNPCDRNNGGCAQVCMNQNGLAVCSCPPNWFLNSDKVSCGYDPCGSNNGGCEQLCTASGNQAKCDCRVGTLNTDRRTCGSQIIVVGTVPPGLVLGCQFFMFDFSTAFSHAGGKPLTFRLSGLSPQTGFAISAGGLLSGTPTDADCASAQPMTLTVTATDGVASVQAVMFLSAFCDNSCKKGGQVSGGTSPNLPVPSPASSIPLMWAWVCREFNFDLSRYFIGAQGSVSFSALGLPQGTGFQMATQGVLQGTPNSVDCARSPLMVTIIARDSAGRESKAVVTIKFSSCGCVQNPSFKGTSTSILPSWPSTTVLPATTILPSFPSTTILPSWPSTTISTPILPVAQTILPAVSTSTTTPSLHTHAVAECGQPFFLDSSEYFRVNGLNYKLSGLPPGTGLRLSDSGVLSGTPNSIDARSVNPLVGAIVGTDRTGASVTLVVDIEIKGDCGSIPPPSNQFVTNFRSGFALAPGDSNTGILPVQNAIARQFFRLDLSRVAFSGLRGKLRYEASGLPSNSGLSLSPAGVLSGIPSDRSCSETPVPLTVSAIQDSQRANATLYVKFSCDAKASVLTGGSQLPTITGVVGELLYYDCAPYMTSQSSNVTFSVAGLESASGLRMSTSGVLSGVPSAIDIKGPSLLVTARDAAGRVVQNTVRLNVVAQASANHAPTFIPLETVHTSGDQPFSVNMRQRFYDEDGDNITLSVVGLSNQSGIKFDAVTGVLSGTPSSYDLKATQPVVLTTLADDGNGGRTEGSVYVFFVSGNQQVSTPQNVTVPVASTTHQNRDPISLSIKRQVGIEGVPFLFGVASSFVDQDGDVLTYSLEGLPRDTGLAIDRSSGVIAGTPSRADAEALQPISITISVTDGQGGSCAQIFLLTVFQGEESSNHEPDARAIADVTTYVGDLLMLRLSSNFADSDGDALNYSATGLPTGTGLQLLTSSGIFTGTPTSQDQAASPIALVVHVDDGRGGQAKSSFKLTVNPSSQKPKTQQSENTQPKEVLKKVSPSGVVSIQFEIGKPSFFAAASLFPTHLTGFAVSGLPVGTGLAVDRKTGVLSGSPTLQDVIAADSLSYRLLPLTISTTGKAAANMTQVVMLSLFSSLDAANHAPFARIIPKSQAFPGHEFLLNVWGSFADPDGDSMLFSVIGLPPKSGFQIEPKQGVFFGIPSEADITAPQPLVLTIVADDQRGGKAQENLLLTVSESNSRVKSCRQLGWDVVPGSSLCARAPKVLDGCVSTITFADAQKYCSALGARLCSSQELSDPRFSDSTGDECDVKNKRVWTSSWCADSEVITQASTSDSLISVPKECSAQESRAAMLKCCANSDETGPKAYGEVIAASEKTCEQLPSFVTAASSPNKAVCSTSMVVQKLGKGTCSGDVTFDVAKDMCAKRGARLCTADELSQDVGADQACGYSSKRVWTSSQCPFEGQVLTQAGSSAFLRSIPKQCTKTTATYPVYCCADQKRDQFFQNLAVNATSKEISLTWNWKVYPNAQVSLRKASASKGNVVWTTPKSAKDVAMGGDASVSLSALEAATRYAIRITPLNQDQKLVKSQAVEFRVSTT